MTTVIGIQGEGFAVLAADTRITSFSDDGPAYQMATLGSGVSKIAANGKYLLGTAGDLRAINLLTHAFSPPPPPPGIKGKKLDQFITVKFIPALRSCFDTHGYSAPENKENKNHNAEQGSSILVVVNATIYMIDNDYSWLVDASGLYSVGSGSDYALGAAHALAGGKKLSAIQAKGVCLKALSIAAKMEPHTGSPYHTYIQTMEPKAPAKKK
jgi:ATP-dependent protease HslVU (ClpYQ) peptidase subunit